MLYMVIKIYQNSNVFKNFNNKLTYLKVQETENMSS